MGPLGFPEIALIVFIALLVFGPDRLPDLARQLGRAMREVRSLTQNLRFDLDLDLDDEATKPAAAGDPALPAASPDPAATPAAPVDFSNLLPARAQDAATAAEPAAVKPQESTGSTASETDQTSQTAPGDAADEDTGA